MTSKAFQTARSLAAMGSDPKAYADQAATDAAALVDAKTDFTIIYPNGGSEGSEASIGANYREEMTNPFPGSRVDCRAEIFRNGVWGPSGWAFGTSNASGLSAGQDSDDNIVVQAGQDGVGGLYSASMGGVHGDNAATVASAPARVLVWKEKGVVS